MKQKLLSLLLVITLIAVTVSVGFPATLAESEDNLFVNGDFSDYSGDIPTNWTIKKQDLTNVELVKDVEIKDGLKANALKFTTTGDSSSRNALTYAKTIKIEKNAKYTMTYWVKVKNIKGLRTYMFEPTYVALDGTTKTNTNASEGTNIYTYTYDNGSTRVSRPDIKHSWTIAETGAAIDNSVVSMFISRSGGTEQPLAPDYPTYSRQGEWLQVVHTFETGNSASHEADVSYDIVFPQYTDGEVWVADFRMSVIKAEIDAFYAPEINDDTLGCVSPIGEQPLYNGKEATYTAEAFGENKFQGWYNKDGELVTTDAALTFVYDPANPPEYEARFAKSDFGIDGSFETGYTNGQLLAQAVHAKNPGASGSDWTETSFLSSEKNGSGFVVDSHYGGTWRKATITNAVAHTGKQSVLFAGQYGAIGHKFTGLAKNTEYILSVYAYLDYTPSSDWPGIEAVVVTGGNESCLAKNSSGNYRYNANALYYSGGIDTVTRGWAKIEVTVDTRDNDELILWLGSSGTDAKLYLDNFAIARAPFKLKPSSNDYDLGFVSPVEGAAAYEGQDVTVTATPIDGNSFEGWYVDGELVSTSAEYTHKFDPDYSTKLVAHFAKGDLALDGAGLEKGYTNGQLLATYGTSGDWHENAYIDGSEDGNWFVDSDYAGTWRKATITNAVAHTGKQSVLFAGQYGAIGRKFTGLKPNTDYAVSYYIYMVADTVTTTDYAGVNSIYVTGDYSAVFKNNAGKVAFRTADNTIAKISKSYNCLDGWTKITVPFNTGNYEEVIVWTYSAGKDAKLYLDNFGIFEPIAASVAADLGGKVSSNLNSDSIPSGTKVELKAEPLEGNTFVGWVDLAGKVVSTDANYSFVADESFTLTAKFEGYNMPAYDVFAAKGNDGTFENGTITGFFADDPTYGDSVSWCSWTRNNTQAYEGSYSLKVDSRYRNTVLPITGLVANTNYRLSFYVKQPDTDHKAAIDSMGVVGGTDDTHLNSATARLTGTAKSNVAPNTGWNRIDFYFNTKEFTSVSFILRITTDNTKEYVYIDNMTLYQFAGAESLANGNFADGKNGWVGDADAVNGVAALADNDTIYQTLATEARSLYRVTFRAKGSLTASAQEINVYDSNVKGYLTSQSFVTTSGNEWKEYSFDAYTNLHRAMNLVIKADGNAEIDDVKVVKVADASGAVLEHIDFESERFDLTNSSDSFSIYHAEGSNDKNVLSGNRSLKFTYNPALASNQYNLDEAFTSFNTIGASWKLSFNYKIVNGGEGGAITLAPDMLYTFGADVGFEHTSRDDGWHNVTYFFNNINYMVTKLLIANMANSTASDFYIDDIVITVAPPMVSETGTKLSYCEALYNVVENESFEQPMSNKDWKGATANMKVAEGTAQKGSHFLRVNAKTHYVLELDVEPNTEYYFGASVRGTAATDGYIGIAVDETGSTLYADTEERPASLIRNKAGSTEWERSAFRFVTNGTGKAYLVIDVTSGALDIDSVMFFTSEYGYRYDPNDYTVYVPYDYDNLKSGSVVINGGLGAQPYFEEEDNGATPDSPVTADTIAFPVVAIVIATAAAAMLLVIRKRKEGVENNA